MTLPTNAIWRFALVGFLFALPVLAFAGFGAYYLNTLGYSFVAWIGLFLCSLSGYLLLIRWTRKGSRAILPDPGYDDALPYWTDRDKEAWKSVEVYASEAKPPQMDDFSDPNNLKRYAEELQVLAARVAEIYKPGAKDPFEHLTLTELMTAAELVAQDLGTRIEKYVPGSSTFTLKHFKQARQAMGAYQQGMNVYWVVSAFFNPMKTAAQLAANKLGAQSAWAQIQNNVLHWFFLAFLHDLGRYLIELNSGRLKVGAKRYRELMAKREVPPAHTEETAAASATEVDRIGLALIGPVSSGKSSLINAFFGQQRAAVAQTPLTDRTTKYELDQPGLPPLVLYDTVGFGVNGATDIDVKSAVEAMDRADLALLVLPARSAARAPEVDFLDRMTAAFARRPELKKPPIVAVLTMIDQLTPAMEWQPPYDWAKGTRTKEVSIREAVSAAKDALSHRVAEVVPVCSQAGRLYGVKEELLPEIVERLGEARGVGLLRALHMTDMIATTKKIAGQVWQAGRELVKAAMQGGTK